MNYIDLFAFLYIHITTNFILQNKDFEQDSSQQNLSLFAYQNNKDQVFTPSLDRFGQYCAAKA